MSAAVRTALSADVSAVDGLNCTPYYRQSTQAGEAMVRLARMERDDSGLGFMNIWQVLLILPANYADAERYMETKLPALLPAVAEHIVITSVTPQELVLENGTSIPAVVIEGARESE